MIQRRTFYPELQPYNRGRLRVSPLHEIYFEECGNPAGKTAVVLHGGPGGGISPFLRQLHDPAAYRIILFDQRGCGQSDKDFAANTIALGAEDAIAILDHLGKPAVARGEHRRWREEIRTLSRHPHIFCKLSGLVTEARRDRWSYDDLVPYMETAAEFFGTERLCFGSDWPVCLTAADYGTVTETVNRFLRQVAASERDRVMGLNAKQFYGI